VNSRCTWASGHFSPVHSDTLEGHVMHSETYGNSRQNARNESQAARDARRPGSGDRHDRCPCPSKDAALARQGKQAPRNPCFPGKAEARPVHRARIFIFPRLWKDCSRTFICRRSTLLALVCAFAGPRKMFLAAYNHAVEAGYPLLQFTVTACSFVSKWVW